MKKLIKPWEGNPSEIENFYDDINEATKLEPDLGGEIDDDTHKLLKKDEDKDENELEGFEKEITEEADPYADILKDLK